MIVRRNRSQTSKIPRAIVRRGRETVGQKAPRMIVRRARGGSEPPAGGGRRFFRLPRPGRGWLLGLALVGVAAMLGGAGYWLWASPFFRVNTIEVIGNERIGADVVVGSTNLLGESMFTADLATAQKALYQQPLVHSVRIERHWPATLRVVIEERKSWGIWEQGGVRYTIDRDGVVLGTVIPVGDSPVIRSAALGSLRQGDRVDYQAVDAAAEIYERLPRQLGTTVTEVAHLAGKGVQVTTATGESALLGDSSSVAYKLAVWAALRREAEVRGINYTIVDLRYGNRPVLQ